MSQQVKMPSEVLTVTLADESLEAIREIAKAKGLTLLEAMKNMLADYRLFVRECQAGSEVRIHSKDGRRRVIRIAEPLGPRGNS